MPVNTGAATAVCVTWVDLDHAAAHAARLASFLREDELEHAARAPHPLEQARRLAARAFLRLILGHAVGQAPASLHFSLGSFGKPALDGFEDCHFSLSHSQGRAAVAVSAATPVGLDIEHVAQATPDAIEGALSTGERAALATLPPSARDHAFTRIWVRKEALLKAAGVGLSVDPRSLTVARHDLSMPFELTLPEVLGLHGPWSLVDLEIDRQVIGTLAYSASAPLACSVVGVDISLLFKPIES